jgi:hypothetical protein
MELTFNKEGDKWVAECEVSGDFNFHVEKKGGAFCTFVTSVQGGDYDVVRSLYMSTDDGVMDKDVTALYYPKYLRVEAYTKTAPTVIVSFNA